MNGSHCTPPTPMPTPPLTQRITPSPLLRWGSSHTQKPKWQRPCPHAVPVLLKYWSPAPVYTVAHGTPRLGPSYGEAQITAPPVVFPTMVQITNICQSQKYTCSPHPTAPPWSPHQYAINPKPATDRAKLLDPLISISSNTSLSFASSLSMDALIASFQKHMVKAPPYGSYPTANLMVSYASDSLPALVGPP